MSLSRAKASALLIFLSFALYAPTIGYGFIDYDDQRILLGQPHLFQTPFWAGLRAIFTDLPREEPLLVRDLSWLIDAHLFGFKNPLGYHLGNVVLNALNTALLYLFLLGTIKRPNLALIIAALFAVQPLHVEPVCWVMGRKDLLSTFFMLVALTVQNRLLAEKRTGYLYAGTIASVGFAALAKISAVSFFLVLFLHRALHPYLTGEHPRDAPIDRRRVLHSALAVVPHAVVSVAIALWYQAQLQSYGLFGRGPPALSLQHLETLSLFVPVTLLENARLILFPWDLQLFYDFPAIGGEMTWYQLAGAYLFAAALIFALVRTFYRRKDLFFYLASAAALISLHLNLVYIGIWIANRYLYLISAWVIALAATIAAEHLRRPVAIGVGAGYAFFLLAQTAWIIPAWRDNESLWEHEAALAEPSMLALSALVRVHVRRAEKTEDAGKRAAAIAEANALIDRAMQRYESLGIRPVPGYLNYQYQYYGKLHHFRARIMALEGAALAEQLAALQEAYRTEPSSGLHNMSLAETYFKLAFSSTSAAERSELARRSLAHFETYARSAINDTAERRNLAVMLQENYTARFPELREEIERVRTTLGL